MKDRNLKLFSKAVKETVIRNKIIESIHLSFEIECERKDFEGYIRQAAKFLESQDLENVEAISVQVKLIK